MNQRLNEAVQAGPVSEWIERYYEDKLDRRPNRKGPSARLLNQALSLN